MRAWGHRAFAVVVLATACEKEHEVRVDGPTQTTVIAHPPLPPGPSATCPPKPRLARGECASDEQCRLTGTKVCQCEVVQPSFCRDGNCHDDADCVAGFHCGGEHFCHSRADECQSDADCAAPATCRALGGPPYRCVVEGPPPG